MAANAQDAILLLFDRLETVYGKLFVSRTLGYIVATRFVFSLFLVLYSVYNFSIFQNFNVCKVEMFAIFEEVRS